MEETHKQVAGVSTGGEHCRGEMWPVKTIDRRLKFVLQVTAKDIFTPNPNISIARGTRVSQQLTDNVLVMLRDELFPVALIRRGEVDVDEAVTRGVQVGLEREQRALVGHVLVLSVEVVN